MPNTRIQGNYLLLLHPNLEKILYLNRMMTEYVCESHLKRVWDNPNAVPYPLPYEV